MAHVTGVGIDLVEIDRIRRALHRSRGRFLGRVLSPAEQEELRRRGLGEAGEAAFVAGRFAAKEAVAKAIGVGVGRLGPGNISITVDRSGTPLCSLAGRAFATARALAVGGVLVSITHTGGIAAACAVALGRE